MLSIYLKEIRSFFSSLIAYLVIGVFLLFVGLFMWVFKDTSVLDYRFASMHSLFAIAPMILMLIIPALTMRTFADEKQNGTLEFLFTKPVKEYQIVLAKYLASFTLVVVALIPTLIYYYSICQLGLPKGNIDGGAVFGSYLGLIFLSLVFLAIGNFASSITENQISSFILGAFLCFLFYMSFSYLSSMDFFFGKWDNVVEKIGLEYHYQSISRGKIEFRDIFYFISLASFFIWLTMVSLSKRKWS